jgi:hypothetical protein
VHLLAILLSLLTLATLATFATLSAREPNRVRAALHRATSNAADTPGNICTATETLLKCATEHTKERHGFYYELRKS